jgi:predicted MFS family arabinose efflux permease
VREGAKGRGGLGQVFWFYALFTFLSVAGFANFQLISYHFAARSVVPVAQIPLLYAIAMGLDALMALAVGRAYDKIGLISLVVVPFLTIPIPFLAFSQSYTLAVISVLLWGTVMAVHETTMRAAIADITPVEHRGFAYGVFNTIYGASWFVGSALMGVLYDVASRYLISFVVVVEVVALLAFFLVRKANQKSILR